MARPEMVRLPLGGAMRALDEQTRSSCLVWLEQAGGGMAFSDEQWASVVAIWGQFLQETSQAPHEAP